MSTGPRRTASSKQQPKQQLREQPIEVDPRWLLRAIGFTVVAALLCGYLALGYLFAQGAWQLVLHPTHNPSNQPLLLTGAQPVHFFANESGKPQLAGEWIPAEAGGIATSYVFLVCRTGDGQLSAADAPIAELIQSVGGSAFFFDYRGFGQSSNLPRPSGESMATDAEQAWTYLTQSRHVSGDHIILYGNGIGAVFAARLAQHHTGAAALVLHNADADADERIRSDARGRLFPVRLLLGSSFDLYGPLAAVTLPKLLFLIGPPDRARDRAYRDAGFPKSIVTLSTEDPVPQQEALERFLGDHLGNGSYGSAQPRKP